MWYVIIFLVSTIIFLLGILFLFGSVDAFFDNYGYKTMRNRFICGVILITAAILLIKLNNKFFAFNISDYKIIKPYTEIGRD